jgi:membrane protein
VGQNDGNAVRVVRAAGERRPAVPRRLWLRARREARISLDAAWRALVGLATGSDFTHAASIAYCALLAVFPFLLLTISFFGMFAADEAVRARVLGFVLRYFPARFDFLTDQIDAFRTERFRIGALGGVGLVWASLGFFGAVTGAVNEAWGVAKQRGFWKHRLVSFLMMLAAGGTMTLGLVLVSLFQIAQASKFGQALASVTVVARLQTFFVRDLATVLLVGSTGLIFYFVPNARIRFRDVWVGAILTGLLWRVALWAFSWYLRASDALQMIHGSIAAVIVFLLWIYVSSVIFMFGVEFTAAHARLRRHKAPRPQSHDRASALQIAR